MLKWLPDKTGRFAQYPHYDPEDLDNECEKVVRAFLVSRHGRAGYPITTDDLTVLVEQYAGSLDQFADLPEDTEGRTRFHPPSKPDVAISARLQEKRYENRLRTTLTHELGHVVFHAFIWEFEAVASNLTATCYRDRLIGATPADWMEWQAGYASGAFLIPRSAVIRVFGAPDGTWPSPASLRGADLIARAQKEFAVSEAAARVRLAQLKYVLPD